MLQNKLKTPKNRMPMQSDNTERRSAFSVRVIMKEFCIEFLNGAYNSLMHYIRVNKMSSFMYCFLIKKKQKREDIWQSYRVMFILVPKFEDFSKYMNSARMNF